MSVYIFDDEQSRDRPATPTRPSGSGGAGANERRRSERDPSQFSDKLLGVRKTSFALQEACR